MEECINVDESHINSSLETVGLAYERDKSRSFIVTSLMFPEIKGTSRSFNEAVEIMKEKLRSYQPYRFKILYSWIR